MLGPRHITVSILLYWTLIVIAHSRQFAQKSVETRPEQNFLHAEHPGDVGTVQNEHVPAWDGQRLY